MEITVPIDTRTVLSSQASQSVSETSTVRFERLLVKSGDDYSPVDYENFMEKNPEKEGGRAVVKGTGMPVCLIIEYLQNIETNIYTLIAEYTFLSEKMVLAAQKYYLLNREEIDKEIEQNKRAEKNN